MKNKLVPTFFTTLFILSGLLNGFAQDVWTFGNDQDCIVNDLGLPACTQSTSNVIFQYEGINENTLNIFTAVPASNFTWTIIPGADDDFEFIAPSTSGLYQFTLFEDLDDSGGGPDIFDCVLGVLAFNVNGVQITNDPYTPEPICSGKSTEEFIVTTEPAEGVSISWTATTNGVSGLVIDFGDTNTIPKETLTTTGSTPGSVLYKIIATLDEDECTAMYEYIVTVNPIPEITNTVNETTICDGENFDGLELMTNVSETEISWTATFTNIVPETPNSDTGDLPVYSELTLVNTAVSGTVVFTAILSNDQNGCVPDLYSYVYTVFVNPFPMIEIISSPMCEEDLGFYSLEFSSNSTVIISSNGDITINTATNTISNIPSGNSEFTITAALNGCETTIPIESYICTCLTITPPDISVSGESVLCEDENNPMLEVEGLAGHTITWYTINGQDTTMIEEGEEFTPTNTSPGTYSYYASYTNNVNMCESVFDSTQFTIKPIPEITFATEMNEICSGDMVNIELSSIPMDAEFSWTVSEDGVMGAEEDEGAVINQTLNGDGTATYEVTASLNGCSSNGDIVVTVNGLPDVSINSVSTTEVCEGTTINLQGESMGEDDIDTWTWSGPNDSSMRDLTKANASTTDAGQYTLTVMDDGCTSEVSIEVVVNDQIEIEETVENVLCNGQNNGSISLSLTGGFGPFTFNIEWDTEKTSQPINDLEAGSYAVTITSGTGPNRCKVEQTFAVNEPDKLIFEDIVFYAESCDSEDDGKVILSVEGGTPNYSYQQDETDIPDGTIEGLSDGDFIFIVTDDNGCTDITSVEIKQGTIISPNVDYPSDLSFCEGGGTIEIIDSSTYSMGTELPNIWTINGEVLSGKENISLGDGTNYSDPGNYNISLLLKAMANPESEDSTLVCTDSPNIPDVTIYDTPEIIGITFDDQDIADGACRGDMYLLSSDIQWFDNNAAGSSIDEYSWDGPNPQTSNDESPEFETPNTGVLSASLKVTSNEGCISSLFTDSQDINENPIARISGQITTENFFVTSNEYTVSSLTSTAENNQSSITEIEWSIQPNSASDLTIVEGDFLSEELIIIPELTGNYDIMLTVKNEEECYNDTIISRLSSNCNAVLESAPDILNQTEIFCQGDAISLSLTVRNTLGSNNNLEEVILQVLNNQKYVVVEVVISDLNNAFITEELNFTLNTPGTYSVQAIVTETGTGGCDSAAGLFGSIEIQDLLDLKDTIVTYPHKICAQMLDGSQKVQISNVGDIESSGLIGEYTISTFINGNVVTSDTFKFDILNNIEINIPSLSDLGEIFMDDFNINNAITFNFGQFPINNSCGENLDLEIEIFVEDCAGQGILGNIDIDNSNSPQVGMGEKFICSNDSVGVEARVTLIDDNFGHSVINVITDVIFEELGENISLMSLRFIELGDFISTDIFNNEIQFNVNVPYNIYTIIKDEIGNAVVFQNSETIEFLQAPESEMLIVENEFCQNGLIEITMGPQIGENYNVDFKINDENIPKNQIENNDSTGYFILDNENFPEGSSHYIVGIASFNYSVEGISCSTESEPFFFIITEEAAPERQDIRWWPNNILTSEDTETTEDKCFQWGVIDNATGDDISNSQLSEKEVNQPYLFTDDNQFEEFKNSPSNPNTDFSRIYYLDTWFSDVSSCDIRPEGCYTRVFFTEDQFKFRDEESQDLDLAIRPNPSNGRFFISLTGDFFESRISITNRLGQLVTDEIKVDGGPEVEVELGEIPSGVYFLTIQNKDGESLNSKLVITNQ